MGLQLQKTLDQAETAKATIRLGQILAAVITTQEPMKVGLLGDDGHRATYLITAQKLGESEPQEEGMAHLIRALAEAGRLAAVVSEKERGIMADTLTGLSSILQTVAADLREAEQSTGRSVATPDASMVKLTFVELVRSMQQAGQIAATLAEQLPEIAVQLNALSVELYNGAVELKNAWNGIPPAGEPEEKSPESFREAQLAETEAWGLFDPDDLSAEQPFPVATFESEDDAKGYALLKKFIDAPVVRLCKVRGTVSVDVAPSEVVGHG